jgi:HAE1 family hydrophobic/amphiphilic exporter-1
VIRFSIRRPIAISMVYLSAALLGIAAWRNIPLELLPDTSLPRLTIDGEWRGASPETMEAFYTSPLESAVQQVRGVEKVTSRSSQQQGVGRATVSVEFARGTDMNFARLDLLERLGSLADELPPGAQSPRVSPYTPQEFQEQRQPFLAYQVTGPYTQEALREQVDEIIAPSLRQIDGVADVNAGGGRRRVLEILLDEERLAAFSLNPQQVRDRIRDFDFVSEAGRVERDGVQYTVAIRQSPDSAAELLQAVVREDAGRIVRLRDVATVRDTYEEPSSLQRIDGFPAVAFQVIKKLGTNTVAVADEVKQRISELESQLMPGTRLIVTRDESEEIRTQLTDLRERSLVSAAVIFAVLLIFLGSYRSVLIVCATIAFSVLIALNLMYFLGFSLNVLTLMGLAMGFGLIADNAIVVLENIFRRWRAGEEPHVAAEAGAREVVLAILTATATTLVVFIPFVYLQGELRVYYVPLALVVGLSLAASLFVAFSFIPALGARLLRSREAEAGGKPGGQGARLTPLPASIRADGSAAQTDEDADAAGDVERVPARIENARAEGESGHARRPIYIRFYAALLRGTLRFPWATVILCAALVGGSWHLFDKYVQRGVLWRGFGGQSSYLDVIISQPRGEELARTDELARHFEDRIGELPHISRFETMVTPQRAQIRIDFADSVENTGIPEAIKEELTAYGFQFGGAEVRVYGYGPSFYGGGGSSPNYRITIYGYNYLTALEIAEGLKDRLERSSSRVHNVDVNASGQWGYGDRVTEVVLELDRDRLAMHGLTVQQAMLQISAAAQGASLGGVGTQIRVGGEERDLSVKLEGYRDYDVLRLANLIIPTRDGGGVRLGDVAHIDERRTLGLVERENQEYKRVVAYEFRGPTKLGDQVHETVMNTTRLPEGYKLEGRQEWRWGDDEARQLYGVLALSLVLVFMVTASLFESLRQPFCVLLTVPMALIGVFVIFFYANASFTREAVIGVIMMGGIVVNNAILLVDRVNQLRRQHGMSLDIALVEGTLQRVRPILMTSVSTILGLLPLVLFSEYADKNIWNALGYALIGGLSSSTFLVLTVTPAIYLLLERPKRWGMPRMPRFRRPKLPRVRLPRFRKAASAATALLVMLIGCGTAQGDGRMAAVRADSAGVEIVTNTGDDRPVAFSLEHRLTIGGQIDGPEAFGSLSRDGVAAAPSGHLVLLDAQSHRVHVYDTSGVLLVEFGREGGGPGELRYPASVAVDPAGVIHVFDRGKLGFVRFSLDGAVLDEEILTAEGAAPPDGIFLDGDRRVVQRTDWGPPPGLPAGGDGRVARSSSSAPEGMVRQAVIVEGPGRADTILVTDRSRPQMKQLPGCGISVALDRIFTPQLAWHAGDGRVVVSRADEYRVDLVYSDGHRRSVRRSFAPTPSSVALATRQMDGFGVRWPGGSCEPRAGEMVAHLGMVATLPAIQQLRVGPDGSLWVQRFAVKGDTALVDVFDSDGTYAGTLPQGTLFPAAFLPNGDPVFVARDDLDLSRVEIWRVVLPAGDG